MSEAETNQILTDFEEGRMTEAEAIGALIRSGVSQTQANEMVWIAGGGSDVVEA